MKPLVFLFTAALAFPSLAQENKREAQFPEKQSAKELLIRCASSAMTPKGQNRRQYCAGFVSGVEETLRLLHRTGESAVPICPPPGISAARLAEVFLRYANRNPGDLGKPASEVVRAALIAAYTCPQEHRELQ